jgi:hypothetical protein
MAFEGIPYVVTLGGEIASRQRSAAGPLSRAARCQAIQAIYGSMRRTSPTDGAVPKFET